jgi:hypothetical protein
MSYLVLDIETVPDESLLDPVLVETSATPTSVEPPFPPPYAHRPVAIGCLLLSDNLDPVRCGCLGVSKFGNDEKLLLSAFVDFVSREKPTIVTWNGRGFDLPVLTLRSFKYGIPLPFYDQSYRYRFDDKKNTDLFDLMTDFGAVSKKGFKLDKIARLIGLPGKYGVDGSMVKEMFDQKRFADIEHYCITDVLQTAFVFFRYQLWRDRISADEHNRVASLLINFLEKQENAPYEKFISLIDREMLLVKPV